MKTFEENLNNLAESLQDDYSGIAKFADITYEELLKLKDGTASSDILYKFCVNTGFSLFSIYSDEGFTYDELTSQYAEYPSSLKKMISRLFCKRLIKFHCAGSESQFKMLLKVNKMSQPLLTRVISGHSCFSPSELNLVFSGMSSVLPILECKQLLGRCMYSLIPNYNFALLRKHFKVTYEKLSKLLGITGSATSNWGSVGAVPIPEQYHENLAYYLGGFTKEEFTTKILAESDFKDRSANLLSSSNLMIVDPPSDESPDELKIKGKKKPAKRKKSKTGKIKPEKKANSQSRQDAPSDNLMTPAEDKLSAPSKEVESIFAGFSDEMVTKMYKNLSVSNKIKADKLIAELYFSQI